MVRWLIFFGIVVLIDFYAFQSVKTLTKSRWIQGLYWVISLGILGNLFYQLNTYDNSKGLSSAVMLAFGLIVLSIVPKLIMLTLMVGEDLVRIFKGLFSVATKSE